jgi:hypothetical protein
LKAKGLAGESITGSQTKDFAQKRIESGKGVSAVSIIPAGMQHGGRQIGVFLNTFSEERKTRRTI